MAVGTVQHGYAPPLAKPRHVRQVIHDTGREHYPPGPGGRSRGELDSEEVAIRSGVHRIILAKLDGRVREDLRPGCISGFGRTPPILAEEAVRRVSEAIPRAAGIDDENTASRSRELHRGREASPASTYNDGIVNVGRHVRVRSGALITRFDGPTRTSRYSFRNATLGSTPAARSAGATLASPATSSSTTMTAPKTTGSRGDVSYSSASMREPASSASARPIMTPATETPSPSRMKSVTMSGRVAPSAMRTPISGTRWLTA